MRIAWSFAEVRQMQLHACGCTRTAHRAGDMISVDTAVLVHESCLCAEASAPAPVNMLLLRQPPEFS